jgi:hypothetical protein
MTKLILQFSPVNQGAKTMRYILFIIFILLFSNCFSQRPTIIWQKSLGGSGHEFPYKIIKGKQYPSTGTLAIAGTSYSNDSMVSSHGSSDFWIVLMDTAGAVFQTGGFGYSDGEDLRCITKAWDVGFMLAGSTSSQGSWVGNHGSSDVWIVQIDYQASELWAKCFGGSENDVAFSIIKSSDSCYVICGFTYSRDSDIAINHSAIDSCDAWLFKIDKSGNLLWEKTYGGSRDEIAYDVIETDDHGFLLCGLTGSNDGQVAGNHGPNDLWIIKTDSTGNLLWQKCLGGTGGDYASRVIALNNRYYISGTSFSNDGDVTGNHPSNFNPNVPSYDAWIICIDSSGQLQWEKSLGGGGNEEGNDLIVYNNYLFAACTTRSDDGDVTGGYNNDPDYWIVQLDTNGNLINNFCYGGNNNDYLNSLYIENNVLYAAGSSTSDDRDVNRNLGATDYWIFAISLDSLFLNNSIIENEEIVIYPNPANVVVKVNAGFDGYFRLINVIGQSVYCDNFYENFSLDTKNISTGLYFLLLEKNSITLYKKSLMIEH